MPDTSCKTDCACSGCLALAVTRCCRIVHIMGWGANNQSPGWVLFTSSCGPVPVQSNATWKRFYALLIFVGWRVFEPLLSSAQPACFALLPGVVLAAGTWDM